MESKPKKLIVIILGAVVVLEAVLLVLMFVLKSAETREKLNLRLQLKDVTEELANKDNRTKELEKQIEDLEKARNDLMVQIDDLTAKQKMAEAQTQAAKQATEEFSQRFQRQQEDTIKQLKSFTSESRKTQLALIAKIESLIETKKDLEEQLAKIKQQQQQESSQEYSYASEVPLGTINVQKPTGGPTAEQKAALEAKNQGTVGHILSVDNDYHFAIIDLGRESGIKIKDKLLVLRQEKRIGEVEVKEIYRNMSLTDILTEKTQGNLRKNDKVIPIAAPQPQQTVQ